MSDSRNRTDSLLDEIDELVNDSLERGDQSGTFRGERYDKCSLCGDDYHFFAITTNLVQMRNGSYGEDEFGQGIVDPNYRHADDTSPIVCPGSNYLGPPVGDREWAWYLIRKRGRRPSPRSHPARNRSNQPTIPGVRRASTNRPRTWRFIGPYEPWVVDMQTEVIYSARSPMDPLPRVVGTITTATFNNQDLHPIPSIEWRRANRDDILRETYSQSGTLLSPVRYPCAVMKPIKFEYTSLHVSIEDGHEGDEYPQYIEFVTNYPVWAHQWWLDSWQLIDPDTREVIPLNVHRLPDGNTVSVPDGELFQVHAGEVQPLEIHMTSDETTLVYDEAYNMSGWVPVGTISEEGIIHVSTVRGPQGTPAEAPPVEGGSTVFRSSSQDPS